MIIMGNITKALTVLLVAIFFVGAVSGTIVYYNGVVNERNSKIGSLNNQVASLNGEVSNLTAQVANLSSLQVSLGVLQANLSGLQENLTAANSEIVSLNSQIASLNSEISNLTAQLIKTTSTNEELTFANFHGNSTGVAGIYNWTITFALKNTGNATAIINNIIINRQPYSSFNPAPTISPSIENGFALSPNQSVTITLIDTNSPTQPFTRSAQLYVLTAISNSYLKYFGGS